MSPAKPYNISNLETPYGTANSVLAISNDVLGTFLEVYRLTFVPKRGLGPIGKYRPIYVNNPLRQNKDRGLSFEEFVTFVINHNFWKRRTVRRFGHFSLGAKVLITSVRPQGKLRQATHCHLSSLAFLTSD
jgi:hypothetical protein